MCDCSAKKTNVIVQNATVQDNPVMAFNARNSLKKSTVIADINKIPTMMKIEEEINGSATLADKCVELGILLGLNNPVSEDVLLASLDDPTYAQNLLISRGSESFMRHLLNNPPKKIVAELQSQQYSNAELISRAGKSLLKWGLSGFTMVPFEQLHKREDACLKCSNLLEPQKMLQKITASSVPTDEIGHRTGNKICLACGCVIKNKIRLATDTCPVEAAGTPGINRWGEAFILAANHQELTK